MIRMFTNGNARIMRLLMFELICGVIIMVTGQIMGTLPSQDWLTPKYLKITCFALGTFQVVIKGCEMFFSKTVSMFREYDAGKVDAATITSIASVASVTTETTIPTSTIKPITP